MLSEIFLVQRRRLGYVRCSVLLFNCRGDRRCNLVDVADDAADGLAGELLI